MKKKLFYVVTKELQSVGDNSGVEETTGFKSVGVFEINIADNNLQTLTVLDIENCESSELAIQEYLDDNGMGDDEFELIQL